MVLKILILQILARFFKFAVLKIFECLFFSEFNDHYWPTKLFKFCKWVTWQYSKDKKWFWTLFSLRNLEFFSSVGSIFVTSFSFTHLSHTLSLSLSLTLLLMTDLCCYMARCYHLLPSPHAPSIKLKLASLNRGYLLKSQPLAGRLRAIRPTLVGYV